MALRRGRSVERMSLFEPLTEEEELLLRSLKSDLSLVYFTPSQTYFPHERRVVCGKCGAGLVLVDRLAFRGGKPVRVPAKTPAWCYHCGEKLQA